MEATEALADLDVFGFRWNKERGKVAPAPDERRFPYFIGSKLNLTSIGCIRDAIKASRPDIVHAFWGQPLAHAILATMGMKTPPRIVSFRGITRPLGLMDPGEWISYRHPRVAGHACASEAVRESLISSGMDPGKCHTTYECVVMPSRNEMDNCVPAIPGIPPDAFVVGTIATMRRIKGADLLLKAALRISQEHRDIYWLLIGKVEDREVERLAKHPLLRDRVVATGHRPDAVNLIRRADLFAMPSRAEGLCRALLEAMSVGVCPVVSDACGMKEAVRHEIDGLVVPKENVGALAEAIDSLYQNETLRRDYAISARSRAEKTFSPAAVAERNLELYRKVMADLS